MKSSYKIFLIVLLLNSINSFADINAFIITVKSDNVGPSTNKQFTIPTFGSGYNYNVDCNNDGIFEATNKASDFTCDFSAFGGAGTYDVSIIGDLANFAGFPRIYFNNSGDRLKILDIKQWGANPWTSMQAAFSGASNMSVSATDVPNLSNVSSMALMFNAAFMANPDTSAWDTSNVTNMNVMFQNATSANPDVSNWDTSNVTLMAFMFAGATSANPNLSQWDISSAGDMTNMLGGSAISTINYDAMLINFNSTIPTPTTNINLNNVPTSRCSQAAQSAYTNLILTYNWMINDQGICASTDPANDFVIEVNTNITGSTTNLQFEINTDFFTYNYNVDCDAANAGTNTATAQTGNYICNYATPGIYTIRISDNIGDKTGFPRFYSFGHADAKKIVNLKQWGTGVWGSFASAFRGAQNMVVSAVDIPDLSLVTSMYSMFRMATIANPDTRFWNTSSITEMSYVFFGASTANPDTSLWNTNSVTDMAFMFAGASAANPDTSLWNTSIVTDMNKMFNNANSANPDVSGWNTGNVSNMTDLFNGATLANPDVSSWDTTQVTQMQRMFTNATSAQPVVSSWNTGNVTNMSNMFDGATAANPDVSLWNTSNVTNMSNMFDGATAATPDMSAWDITGITVPNSLDLMLNGITLPTALYDAILANFNSQITVSGIVFSGGNSKYCNVAARDNLTNPTTGHGWFISDGGLDANCSNPADAFVIEVDTTIVGSTTNQQFKIKTLGGGYNYNVDCDAANAGTNTATAQTGDYTCNYATPGVYTIRITDNIGDKTGFPHFYSLLNDDAKKIVNLKQWGTGVWGSFASAFRGALNMVVTATDIPDLSNVTDMSSMFRGATTANPDVTNWDTSSVTDMSVMFFDATATNPDVSLWNTSNVTNMSFMFRGATSANPDVSMWNTSKVTNMASMFGGATIANPDVSGWNTVSVTDMSFMFSGATAAIPDVSSWNTSSVTNMSFMFSSATAANPDLTNWDITAITTTVGSMQNMLFGITLPTALYDAILANFNSQITASGIVFDGGNSKYCNVAARDNLTNGTTGHGWSINDGGLDANCSNPADAFVIEVDTTILGSTTNLQFKIKTLGGGYNYNIDCDAANAGTNTATAQTGDYTCNYTTAGIYTIRITDNVGDKTGFPHFYSSGNNDAKKITDLKQWGTGVWGSFASAFYNATNMVVTATDIPDLSNVTDMSSMFRGAITANPDVSGWDTSIVTNMGNMFHGATSANPDVILWNTSSVTNMLRMFSGATTANPNVTNWNTSSVTNMSAMFYLATAANPNVTNWNTSSVTNMSFMFINVTSANPNVTNWNTSSVTDMSGMFADATSANPDVTNWNTSNVTEMSSMFEGATSANPDVSMWNTSSVTNMGAMFRSATSANPDVSSWITTNVTNMSSMFDGASSANPDVTNWNTSSVTNMSSMFKNATSANPNVSLWNTSSVTGMNAMFFNTTSANPNVANWNTSSVTNMRTMFFGATSANPDVSSWNTSSVTDMREMFFNATSATPDLTNWDITAITTTGFGSMEFMLQGITLPTALYDAILANFNSQITASGIVFDGGNSKYCNVAARDNLMNVHGWNISDGGLDANCSDVIFENSFENTVVFKAAEKQFVYDFSQVSSLVLDDNQLLIARGVDSQNNTVVKIYLRKDLGQLQIRMDMLMGKESETNQWQIGNWQNTDNKNLTVIQWQ